MDLPPQLLCFYCPLETEVNPDFRQLGQRTLAWVRRFDLGSGDPGRATMLGLTGAAYAAHANPHATGELAQAFADYNAWAWAANDAAGSDRSAASLVVDFGRWERIMRSPGSWPDVSTPMDAALSEVFGRLRRILTPVQWERFVAGQSQWLYSMAWEVGLREQGGTHTVNDYLAVRFGSVGCYSAVSYLDAVEGIELSEGEWARPAVRAAAESGMLVAALDNDRTSYNRERKLAIKKHNVFDVIREETGCTFEEAVTEGIAIRDRAMNLYLRLRDQLLASASEDLQAYLTGVDRVISGNINLATAAVRYLDPETAHLFRRVDSPIDSRTDPLPIPTVAWWWEHVDTEAEEAA